MLLLVLTISASFAHPGHTPEMRRWSMDDGLPQSTVTDITQGSDGLLMLATFGGLVRFDGVDFTVWDGTSKGIDSIRVTAVESLPSGLTYFGTQDGQLYVKDDASISRLNAPFMGIVWEIVGHDGHVFAVTSEGLFRVDEGRALLVQPGAFYRAESWPGVGLAIATEGTLVVFDGQNLHTWLSDVRPDDLCVVGSDLIVASRFGLLSLGPQGVQTSISDTPALRLALHGEQIWAASASEVWEVGGSARVDLPSGEVRAFLVDREGSLWVGLAGGGLLQVVDQPYETVSNSFLPRILGGREGDGYAVSSCVDGVGELRILDPGLDGDPLQLHDCPQALAWVGDDAWVGVGDRVFSFAAKKAVVEDLGSGVLAIGPLGQWIGTEKGLHRQGPQGWTRQREVRGPVAAIVRGADGALWVGGGNGLHRLQGGAWTRWQDGGMATTPIRSVWPHGEGAWVGSYGSGMFYVTDDDVLSLTTEQGSAENIVSAMVPDGQGYLWLLGNRGTSRVSVDELDRFASGEIGTVRSRLFRAGEGNGGVQPSGALVDGHVSMPTIHGVVTFDVTSVPTNDVPPRMVLLSARLDGEDVLRGGDGVAGGGDLTVSYTMGALMEPTLSHFRYRMDDGDWVEVGAMRSLSWEGLGPGGHHLEIVGANEDGVWADVPIEFDVFVPPAWHERWWVRALALLGFAGIGFVAERRRTQTIAAHNRRLQAEVLQRNAAEGQLARREKHYRSVFEGVVDGLLLVDEAGVVVEANPAASRLFGLGALVARPAAELVGKAISPGVVSCNRLDGSTFEASVDSRDGPGGRLISVRDLTRLRQSSQAQRLEAIGRLAGGVAHDVNNLLMALSGTGALLREEVEGLADATEADALLDDVDACVDRGATLTRELMAFGRRQLLEPLVVEAQEVIRGVQPMLRRATRDDVQLVVELDEVPVFVRVDAAQLELAVLNLVLNGMAAMPSAGVVTVRVRSESDMAVVEVQDEGIGIPADVLPHIYEPFYTTRTGGTGLGLPSVHGFVTQSGGELRCETTVGVGTLFHIRLPAVPAVLEEPEEETTSSFNAGLVLVCDDDVQVLEALVRMLKIGGFQTLALSDAREATRIDPCSIDLLITDVLMPHVRGPDLAAALRVSRPDLPVLYVSGYTDDIDLRAAPGPLLQKPFRLAALLDAVSELLLGPSLVE